MEPRSFDDVMATGENPTGVLWAINRYIFHPRGLAMGVVVDDENHVTAWTIYTADDGEPYSFTEDLDDRGFKIFEKFLETVKATGKPPPGATE